MQDIEIIHLPKENEPFVVIKKPSGMPSAPLVASDKDSAFSHTAKIIPSLLNVYGKKSIEHGLLHRLDTETSGLLLIAQTQEFYDFMVKEQAEGRFMKTYRAECQFLSENTQRLGGFPASPFGIGNVFDFFNNSDTVTITSYFRNYGKGQKEVRPVTEQSGKITLKKCSSLKKYSTSVKFLDKKGDFFSVECSLTQGYRHQVRCHIAFLNLPVVGDKIYNADEKNKSENENTETENFSKMQFQATKLDFFNPYTEKQMHFEI